jgi:hypothetical protein
MNYIKGFISKTLLTIALLLDFVVGSIESVAIALFDAKEGWNMLKSLPEEFWEGLCIVWVV